MTCGEEVRLSAAVSKGEHSYQSHVRLYPLIRSYDDNYRKYSCPVCASLGLHFSLPFGTDNCFCCGVNLDWDEIDREV